MNELNGPASRGEGNLTEAGEYTAVYDAAGVDSIPFDDGSFLTSADYLRAGPDLVLVGDNGERVLIRDFFADGTPPDLTAGGGLVIDAALATKLAGPVAPGQYAQAGDLPGAEPIGTVDTLEGSVYAVRADGTRVQLQAGDQVFQGDVLETEADGLINIVFVDESTFQLGGDGRMVLDELIYDPANQSGGGTFSVVQGVFSFVSGKIAKTGVDAMEIKTPVATIGIRGTSISGDVGAPAPGQEVEVTVVLTADADGTVGELTVTTNTGFTTTINVPLQGANIAGGSVQTRTFTADDFNQTFGRALGVEVNDNGSVTRSDTPR